MSNKLKATKLTRRGGIYQLTNPTSTEPPHLTSAELGIEKIKTFGGFVTCLEAQTKPADQGLFFWGFVEGLPKGSFQVAHYPSSANQICSTY